MDKITVKNFRCFRDEQTARLAPLTLLVGDNSTGKTSFLALIRALWDVGFRDTVPNFREEPYDLGAFHDIAYNRGGRGRQAKSFEAGVEYDKSRGTDGFSFHVTFEEHGSTPFPARRRFAQNGTWIEALIKGNGQTSIQFGTPTGKWEHTLERGILSRDDTRLAPLTTLVSEVTWGSRANKLEGPDGPEGPMSKDGLLNLNKGDLDRIEAFVRRLPAYPCGQSFGGRRPFAGAPVRSRPRRTYDPARPSRDPEGEYTPTYLAGLSYRNQEEWGRLKGALEKFGQDSGLFDEISVNSLGKTEGMPFQVQVRKYDGRLKGPQRNLMDVGYGVSQALPVITELLREDSPSMFLLQQPEVYLHPSAQAALGSLFCSIAGPDRQIIVETHSDYLLNRVRMDIRDKMTSLKPEDVSVLFFEQGKLAVNIHSLGFDENGNVLNAPPGYRQFFMDEVRRSIGL